MLIDTHCHLNILIKNKFDVLLTQQDCQKAKEFIDNAEKNNIKKIINIGTSLIESINCVELAKYFDNLYASVGIHPNDCTQDWAQDLEQIKKLIKNKNKNKIVAIGECGIDKHYLNYNLSRQKDAFKAQIELALNNNLAIVVHTRSAPEETLDCLNKFKNSGMRGVIHCFSEDINFAQEAINLGFVLGFGGTITYPKNNFLREIITSIELKNIILETDAPYLPPQEFRGKTNYPEYIKIIAEYISNLRKQSFEIIAETTTQTANKIFNL